jgi:protein-tyrosine phosphatase
MTWVEEGIFAAGGTHIPGTWETFSNQTGITAVLHLAYRRPASFRGRMDRFLWLNIEQEIEADLQARELAAGFILASRRSGMSILLHCSSGRHRTRWTYVAYRLMLGQSLKAVLRAAAEKPWMGPYHTDQEQWAEYQSRLQPR